MCENRWDMNLSEIPTGSRKRYDLMIKIIRYLEKEERYI